MTATAAAKDGAGRGDAGLGRLDDVGQPGFDVAGMLLDGLPGDGFAGDDEGHHDDLGGGAGEALSAVDEFLNDRLARDGGGWLWLEGRLHGGLRLGLNLGVNRD